MIDLFNKVPVLLLLIGAAVIEIASDIIAKYWAAAPSRLLFCIAVGTYALGAVIYIPTLLREGLIVTSLVWSLLSVLGYLAVGFFLFHETLSLQQITGVALAIIAIFLLGGK